MNKCEKCANVYNKVFRITMAGKEHTLAYAIMLIDVIFRALK